MICTKMESPVGLRVGSFDTVLALRLSLPVSDSSGGSDNGLEVAVSGLDGGLSSFAPPFPVGDPLLAVLLCWDTGFLTCCSYRFSQGKITREYEFFSCVARPGIPPYPNKRPRSAHFLFFVT